MAMKYADQASTVTDPAFRNRVEAGCMIVAFNYGAQVVTGTGTPTARTLLADAVITRPDFAITQFCWALVGKQQITTVDDLTDVQINTVISQQWDVVAAALTPAPP
jgi:hypothetical protein